MLAALQVHTRVTDTFQGLLALGRSLQRLLWTLILVALLAPIGLSLGAIMALLAAFTALLAVHGLGTLLAASRSLPAVPATMLLVLLPLVLLQCALRTARSALCTARSALISARALYARVRSLGTGLGQAHAAPLPLRPASAAAAPGRCSS